MHDPAVQRQHVVQRTQVARRIEAVQVAEQEARGIADAPVGVCVALEDLLRQRHLVAVVGGRDPQAQDVRTQRIHDVLWLDAVAQRLRHLAAVRVHSEPVGQALPVRRRLVDGDAGQQRTLEPAAVLVGTFQVQVRRLADATRRQHCLMGDAGIEPDIQDVGDAVVLRRFIAQQFGGVQRIPHVHAFAFDPVRNFAHQFHAARMRLSGFAMHEQRDRHAPGALARDGPVRPSLDHAGDARLAPLRIPGHRFDGGQRVASQMGLVHRNEPLRRGAEHHRRPVPPAMRIAVGKRGGRQQVTAAAQGFDEGVVGFPHVHAGEFGIACGRR